MTNGYISAPFLFLKCLEKAWTIGYANICVLT